MSDNTENTTQENETLSVWEKIKLAASVCAVVGGVYVYWTADNVPKCSDTDVLTTLESILQEFDQKQFASLGLDADVSLADYKFSMIRTINENEQTGAFDCKAQVSIHGFQKLLGAETENDVAVVNATYTVSNTDDNSHHIVEVSEYE